MQETNFRFYEFGEFKLDSRRRVLYKDGREIALTPRQFELLFFLVQNEGRLLEHNEILDKVWEGTFVEQSNLKKGISALRQILEETPGESVYIKTVPRRGYSFVARVRPLPENDAELTVERYTVTEIEEIEEEYFIDDERAPEIKTIAAAAPIETETRALPAPVRESAPPAKKRAALIFAAAAALVVVAAAFLSWKFYFARRSPIDFSRVQMAALTNFGNLTGGTVSRTGALLLYSTGERGLTTLWLKNLKTGETSALVKPQAVNYYASAFAPDEKSIYFWRGDSAAPARNGTYRVAIDGGEPQKISENGWASLVFSPDGKRVAYHRGGINERGDTAIFVAGADGANEKLVFNASAAGHSVNFLNWSPDGNSLLFTAVSVKDSRREFSIREVAVETGTERTVVAPRREPILLAGWFPDRENLAVIARDAATQLNQVFYVDARSNEWRQLTFGLNDYAASPSNFVAPDGTSLTVVQGRDLNNLWTGQSDGQNFRQATFDTIGYHPVCGWLDNETVLFAVKTTGNYEIWTMTADGQNRRQLTTDAANDLSPQATADARRVLFLSNRSGIYQVWQMDADGANARQVTNSATDVGSFRVLPDAQTIVYSIWQQGWKLFKKRTDANEFKLLPFTDISQWDTSPDGALIAYSVGSPEGNRIRVASLEENKTLKEFRAGDFDALVWAKDGKALLYDDFYKDRDQIMRQSLDGGEAVPLTAFESDDNVWRFGVSPDGKRIAARRVRQLFDILQIKLPAS